MGAKPRRGLEGQQGAEPGLMGSCVLRCWAPARVPGGTCRAGGMEEKHAGVYERMEEQGKERGGSVPSTQPQEGGLWAKLWSPAPAPQGAVGHSQRFSASSPLPQGGGSQFPEPPWGARGCRVRMAMP